MTNNPTIDGVSRELLERLLTDACNENWSDLNELLHSPNACRCRRFGKDNPHWPCPVHSAQGDQHDPTAAMTEAGCQAYMDADGMIGVMHNSSMGHAYIAMRALDPEVAALQSRIDQLEAEALYAAAGYQAARARIEELESGRGVVAAYRIQHQDGYWCTWGSGPVSEGDLQDVAGGVISGIEFAYAAPPAPVAVARKLEMAQVVRAHMEIPNCPVLTSNQCHALAVKLNACLDGKP